MAAAAQPVQSRPVAGRDYPGDLAEFFGRFQSEADCWNYLVGLRSPDGFRCPSCGGTSAWLTERHLFVCAACRHQTSVTAGTVLREGSRLPLLQWFRAAWLITSRKSGVSASTLQVELGLGSYKTAWMLQHKLRKAMVRPNAPKLSGEIEVDETFVGGPRPGKRGRGAANKKIVVIAVEKPTGHVQYGLGRIRMRVIPAANTEHLCNFVTDVCERGSVIYTDGHSGYLRLPSLGYEHDASVHSDVDDPDWVAMRQRPPSPLAAEALAARHPPGLGRGRPPRLLPGRVHLPLQPAPRAPEAAGCSSTG